MLQSTGAHTAQTHATAQSSQPLSRSPNSHLSRPKAPAGRSAGAGLFSVLRSLWPGRCEAPRDARLRQLIADYGNAAWLFMRRLGVLESDLDDAMQELIAVLAVRMHDIQVEKEKSFVMGTAFRVASEQRRKRTSRREVDAEQAPDSADLSIDLELLPDLERASAILDQILAAMPLELRAPLILMDVEERTLDEIAEILEIRRGTAASRLRRARDEFDERVRRLEAQTTWSKFS